MKKKILTAVLTLSVILSLVGCQGQKKAEAEYPTKTINMIVPYSAGGGTDNMARLIAQYLGNELGVQVNIINKPGAGGEVGAVEFLGENTDGYTIACLSFPDFMISDIVNEKFDFDFYESVNYLATYTSTPLSYFAMADAPFHNMTEFADYCKEHPGEVTVAEAGIAHRVMAAAVMDHYNIDYTLVNFDGANESISALLGGHVMVAGNSNANINKIVAGGGYPIAWGGSILPKGYSELPLFTDDNGVSVDFLSVSPVVVTLKDTPAEVNEVLQNALVKMVDNAEFRQKVEETGYQWAPKYGEDLENYFDTNFKTTKGLCEKYADVVLVK